MKFPKSLSIKFPKIKGIQVTLHWSFLLMFLISFFVDSYERTAATAVLFGIVLLHELGHSITARFFGHKEVPIVLIPFGGAAQIKLTENVVHEFWIVLAGPAVNVALIPILSFLCQKFEYSTLLSNIAWLNWSMLFFNLLPAFPLDGGRLLRAAYVMLCKNYVEGTRSAIFAARVILVFFIGCGIYVGNWWLSLVCSIMGLAGYLELYVLEKEHKLKKKVEKAVREELEEFTKSEHNYTGGPWEESEEFTKSEHNYTGGPWEEWEPIPDDSSADATLERLENTIERLNQVQDDSEEYANIRKTLYEIKRILIEKKLQEAGKD